MRILSPARKVALSCKADNLPSGCTRYDCFSTFKPDAEDLTLSASSVYTKYAAPHAGVLPCFSTSILQSCRSISDDLKTALKYPGMEFPSRCRGSPLTFTSTLPSKSNNAVPFPPSNIDTACAVVGASSHELQRLCLNR